jgi:hypothetical protein
MPDNSASTSKLATSVNPRDRPLVLHIVVNLLTLLLLDDNLYY